MMTSTSLLTSHSKTAPQRQAFITIGNRERLLSREDVWLGAAIFAVALLLGLPLLLFGPFQDGHDAAEHINFTRHFAEQFWNGDLYPRWLIDMNKGLGSPSYFVYPSLPAFVYVLIEPIARLFHLSAFNVAAWLPLVGSGFAAYLWLRLTVPRKLAALCASLFMLMPYHLYIDVYRRCAISESWAFVWMPLLLYFLNGVVKGMRLQMAGFAVTMALFICSHPNSAVIFCWIPFCLSLLIPAPGHRLQSMLRFICASTLGALLASVYLVPAIANAKYMPVSRLMQRSTGYVVTNQLVSFGRGLLTRYPHEYFLQWIAWTVACLALVVIITGLGALYLTQRTERTLVLFWVSVVCLLLFMVSKYSAPAWRITPILHQTVQYTWRLNGPLCVGATAILAMFFARVSNRLSGKIASLVVLVLVLGQGLWFYGKVWQRYGASAGVAHDQAQTVNEHDGWFFTWFSSGADQKAAFMASLGPKVRQKEGIGQETVSQWRPRQIQFSSSSVTGGWVMVNQFYYPLWVAKSLTTGNNLPTRPALPEGLLEVQVPAGDQMVQVSIPTTRPEYIGIGLSLASVCFCLFLCFGPLNKRLQSQQICLNHAPSSFENRDPKVSMAFPGEESE